MSLGIDVGGTFTDLCWEDPERGEVRIAKVRTDAVQSGGLPHALAASGLDAGRCRDLVYSTTLATNAILERRLGACVLVTTRGFRDVIELGRRDRPQTYGLGGSFEPLVPRHLRFEVDERSSAQGEVLATPRAEEVATVCAAIREAGVETVVVSFLNAYATGANEREVARLIAEQLPGVPVIAGSEVHAEWGEFDRTTLVVLNGSLVPLIRGHFAARRAELAGIGFGGTLLAMQSNGGVVPFEHVERRPASLLLSGPAAGVIGASAVVGDRGEVVVTCDMGGTSFDVGMLVEGRPAMTARSQLAFRVPLLMPTVDVHAIAAGGGSIARVVGGRLITVGPDSAGSNPGPACYGLGGELATITDAALVANRFVEGRRFGSVGEIAPDRELAAAAIERHVARPLGIPLLDAAEAVIAAAATVMAGGVRTMSVGRGLDPRSTLLLVSGGAGPLFACDFAREAGIRRILVPLYPGVTNALGCAVTDLRQDWSRTVNADLGADGLAAVGEVLTEQRRAAEAFLREVGPEARGAPAFAVELELQYRGQPRSVTVPLPAGRLEAGTVVAAFEAEYAKWRGIAVDVPLNVKTVRTVLTLPRGVGRWRGPGRGRGAAPAPRARRDSSSGRPPPAAGRRCGPAVTT